MSLYVAVHPDDLRKYDNATLAEKYHVSERTISRAREYHKIQKDETVVEFTEQQYRQHSRKKLAEMLGVTEHYIRKYAREQGWRK